MRKFTGSILERDAFSPSGEICELACAKRATWLKILIQFSAGIIMRAARSSLFERRRIRDLKPLS